jgi:hypothetical protein
MANPIIRLNIDSNIVVVKPDSQPVIVTGNSYFQFTGVTPTVVTDIHTGNLHTISIFTPSGETGQKGDAGDTGLSGITPTLIFTGLSGTTVNQTQTGTTYGIGVYAPKGDKGDVGQDGVSGLTPTLIFVGTGGTIVTYSQLDTTYNISVYAPSGETGQKGDVGTTSWTGLTGNPTGSTSLMALLANYVDFTTYNFNNNILSQDLQLIDNQLSWLSGNTIQSLAGYWNSGQTVIYVQQQISGITTTTYWSGITGNPTGSTSLMSLLSNYVDFTTYNFNNNILSQDLQSIDNQLSWLSGNTIQSLAGYWNSGQTTSYVQTELNGYTTTGTTAQLVQNINTYTGTTAPQTYVPFTTLDTANAISGFINNSEISVAYDWTTRTITLTGDLSYMWHGVQQSLVSPWTSTAHANTVGKWYLYSTDGTNFAWSLSAWEFKDIMVAGVDYQSTAANTFALRETHGLMDWFSHQEFHHTLGTYYQSGGQPIGGTYSFGSSTDAAVTPDFSPAIIIDEDLSTTIPTVTQAGGYTLMTVTGDTASKYYYGAAFPFSAATNVNIFLNNTTTGGFAAGTPNNRWFNVYQILVPVGSDTESQKFRMIFLQPQAVYTSLVLALAEDTRNLKLGSLTNSAAELYIYTRITYLTSGANNYGKVNIPNGGITYITGNRMSQTSVGGVTNTNHANLSNLDWNNSAHTGTNDSLAAFDGTGAAQDIPKATFSLSGHTHTGVYQPFTPSIVSLTGNTTLNATHENKIMECNGTFTVTFPNSMVTGCRYDVVNIGTGTITLAASTTLVSDGTKLATRYTGASAYHRGLNVWLAMGKLTT